MSSRRFAPASAVLFLGTSFAALVAEPAYAQTKDATAVKMACVQASDKAQQLRLAGKLVAARDTLRTCVLDACPGVVREACTQWLGEVTASLPSIVIGAKDSDGKDLLDLRVSIDGALMTEHLAGRAFPIDPGRHKMRYEKTDGSVVEEEILVGEGTKNREVSVVFPGPTKPTTSDLTKEQVPPTGAKAASTQNTVIGSVLAVVGAGALGTALYLDLSATSDVNALKASSCATTHTCPASRVSNDSLDYDLAGVGLGIGIVAVGVATYIFIAHPFGSPSNSQSSRSTATGASLRIVPSPHGSGLALTF